MTFIKKNNHKYEINGELSIATNQNLSATYQMKPASYKIEAVFSNKTTIFALELRL